MLQNHLVRVALLCSALAGPAYAGTTLTLGAGSVIASVDRSVTFDELDYTGRETPLSDYRSGGLYVRTNGNSFYGDDARGTIKTIGIPFNPFHLTIALDYSYADVGGGFYFPYEEDAGNYDWVTIQTDDGRKIYGLEFLYGNGWTTGQLRGPYPWGNSNAYLDWKTLVAGNVVSSGQVHFLSVGSVIGFRDPDGFDQLMVRALHPEAANPDFQELAMDNLNVALSVGATIGTREHLLSVGLGGATRDNTAGSNDPMHRVGYADVTVNSGSTPYGTAVFIYKQNGITVSEAGVPSSPPTMHARIFIDYRFGVPAVPSRPVSGTIDVNTGIALVNRGSGSANIAFTLLDMNGLAIAAGHGTLAAGSHIAKFINELGDMAPDFALPPGFQFATLEIVSDQPLSVLALRMTTNQRNDALLTTTPVADMNQPQTDTAVYFPQLADGDGWTTSLILLNTSSSTERGVLRIFDNNGLPLVVQRVGGIAASSFTYSIPPGGAFHFQTDGSPQIQKIGWTQLVPALFNATPAGSGVFSYNPGEVLITESGIPSALPTTHARIYVDLSENHNTGLAIGNVTGSSAEILINAFETDGVTPAGVNQGPLQIAGNGHDSKFVNEFISALPAGFTGVLDITSPTPFAALTVRSLNNERNDFLLTAFPVADATRVAPSPIVFPQIVDAGGYVTQFILLSPTGASTMTLRFYDQTGTPADF
jgi:hypothetical protein